MRREDNRAIGFVVAEPRYWEMTTGSAAEEGAKRTTGSAAEEGAKRTTEGVVQFRTDIGSMADPQMEGAEGEGLNHESYLFGDDHRVVSRSPPREKNLIYDDR